MQRKYWSIAVAFMLIIHSFFGMASAVHAETTGQTENTSGDVDTWGDPGTSDGGTGTDTSGGTGTDGGNTDPNGGTVSPPTEPLPDPPQVQFSIYCEGLVDWL